MIGKSSLRYKPIVLLSLCLATLWGCSATQQVPVPVHVPCHRLPADLMTDCPIPALPGETFGDVVDYSVQLITALKKCNAKLRTLREQEARRCEIEETDR